jgi:hypothetical protein
MAQRMREYAREFILVLNGQKETSGDQDVPPGQSHRFGAGGSCDYFKAVREQSLVQVRHKVAAQALHVLIGNRAVERPRLLLDLGGQVLAESMLFFDAIEIETLLRQQRQSHNESE